MHQGMFLGTIRAWIFSRIFMKQLSATEARRNFFHLLDEAARGHPVFIEKRGVVIRMTRERKSDRKSFSGFDYKPYFKGETLDDADRWSWDWNPEKGMTLKTLPQRKKK